MDTPDRRQWLSYLGGLTGSLRAERVKAEVAALLPDAAPDYQEALDAGKFYCVIEKHDEPFNFALPNAESFLWLCAKSTLPVRKVFAHYKNRCPEGDDNFVVTVAGNDPTELAPDSELKFKDLPAPSRGILLLTATRKMTSSKMPSPHRTDSAVEALFSGQRHPVALDDHIRSDGPATRLPSTPARASQRNTPRKSDVHQIPPHSQLSHQQAPRSTEGVKPPQSVLAGDRSPLKARDVNTAPFNQPAEELQYQPRMLDNPFAKDEPDADQELPTRGGPLTQLTNEATPERLEAAVQAGLGVLATLEGPLKDMAANEDATAWLEQITKVKEAAVKTRTVVGVVGNTGAGKSSVINAMLDEERLVPTNCMRACTAVVTELSYNHSKDPATKYRAEIEYIKPEDWRKELTLLWREIFDESGQVSPDVYTAESEAAIAYAKVRAVYHKLTKDDLTRTSVENLMNNKRVRSLLGSSKKFSTSEPRSFYDKLQQFVDSKEKGTEKLDKNGNVATKQKREFESWPLIKVVKIYTKSPALSTGAVIVDLPGVHDSNAARSAVAQGYMKQCTGLWIVAPINRAVDDKAAKTLLGDTFKRQLKFDGTYSAVSFICSKTDDISLTEATESLNLGDRMADLDGQVADIDERHLRLSKEHKEVKSRIEDFENSMKQIEDDQDTWDDLEQKFSQGGTVFAPSVRKRKSSSSSSSPRAKKRHRRAIDSDDEQDEETSGQEELDSEDGPQENSTKTPLTEDEIERRVDELKAMYKAARREKKTLEERAAELRKEMRMLNNKADEIDTQKTAIAIDGRNTYSRTAIRRDFAAGIRELDQEAAEDEDPDSFDPTENHRNYEEVAASLPVFCVSSRAYQKLSGRMKKDSNVPGYSMLAETEIPQLQVHCQKLTEEGRQASCRRFLNSMKQLLGSLGLWASEDGTGIKLTESQKDIEKSFLSKKLKELELALEKIATETMADAADTINDQLFAKFAPAVHTAAQEALPKAKAWGAHKSEGGLYWATYKATTRRSGVFAGAAGVRDFNADLAEPIYKTLGNVWEKAFQRRIPSILQSLKKSASNVLKQFHVVVEDRSRKSGHGLARMGMLGANIATHSAAFGDICQEAVSKLNDGQRELSRQFTPVIAAAMEPVYEQCNDETGKGQFVRMKNAMHAHVGSRSQYMFQEASDQVQSSLKVLCKDITKFYLEKMDDVFLAMKRDYFSIVGGVVGQVSMPKEDRMVRRAVDEAITASDAVFREVIDGDLKSLQSKFSWSTDDIAEHQIKDDSTIAENDDVDGDENEEDDDEEDQAGEMPVADAAPSDAGVGFNDHTGVESCNIT